LVGITYKQAIIDNRSLLFINYICGESNIET